MKYDKDSDLWRLAVTGILKGYTEWRKVRGWRTFSMEWIYLRKYVFISSSFHCWSNFNGVFSENIWTMLEEHWNEVNWDKGRNFLSDTFHLLFYAYLLVECFLRNPKLNWRNVWTKLNEFMWEFLFPFVGIFFERTQSSSLISKARILVADLITRIVRETIADEAFSGS